MKKRRGIRRKGQIRSSISNPTIKNDENIPFQSNSGFVRASLPTASIAAPIAIWGARSVFMLTPTHPKKCQCGFEPNKNARNHVPASCKGLHRRQVPWQ
jgi:hypothetical protein